jgi:ABC-type transport system involved in multi-copper enzyme maturation permease subunit
MRFKNLFLKELKQENAWFTIGLPALIAFEIALFIFSGRWRNQCFGISLLLLVATPFLALYGIAHSHTGEWTRNTSQYLFSLPIRGWHVFLSKLSVQTLILVLFSLIAHLAVYVMARMRFEQTLGITTLSQIMKFWLIFLLLVLPAMSLHAFPYIAAKCFVRGQRFLLFLVSAMILIGFFWYLLPLGFRLFSFLPEATIPMTVMPGDAIYEGTHAANVFASTNFFPGLATWVVWGAILGLGNCLILDRWVQT